jgi:phage terminase small subunit
MGGKSGKKKLSQKQQAFVREYLIDLNAAAAARRAGYCKNRADAMGWENLRKPEIAAAIQTAKDKRAERTEITQDRVLKEYARLAFLDPRSFSDDEGNLLPLHKLSDDAAAAISGFDAKLMVGEAGETCEILKYKFVDKRASLSDVAKHLGLFEKDNIQRQPQVIIRPPEVSKPEESGK